MVEKKKRADASYRPRVGVLFSSTVAQVACAELGHFWRPGVDGRPQIHQTDDFPAVSMLYQLDAELRLFAKRETFRLTTISRNIKKSTRSPKPPKGPVEKILHMLPDVLSALYPGVVYSPFINAFYVLALKYGFVGKNGVADKIRGMGLLASQLEEEKSNFLEELLSVYKSEKFSEAIYAAYRKCDVCEDSLTSLVRSFLAFGDNGARVFCVDLYLHRASTVLEDVPYIRSRIPESYIARLLDARKRFAKKTLNYGHPVLGRSLWLMVPSVGAYGEPIITAWFIVGSDVQASANSIRADISKEWARAAGPSAYCRDLGVRRDPYKAVDTSEFSIGNKKMTSQVRRCFSYLANKSYFIFPDLPGNSDSFWRSERVLANKEKKTKRTSSVSSGESRNSLNTQKEVRRKSRELGDEIKRIEKILAPRKDIGLIPAADIQPEDHQEYVLQQLHSSLLVEKAGIDDQVASLKAANRHLKSKVIKVSVRPVSSNPAEIHQHDVPEEVGGVSPGAPELPSGAGTIPSASSGRELPLASGHDQIAEAIESHRAQLGVQPQGESQKSDGALEKASPYTLVDVKTSREQYIVRTKADAAKSAIERIFGKDRSDEDVPSTLVGTKTAKERCIVRSKTSTKKRAIERIFGRIDPDDDDDGSSTK